ncbi:MAG: ATP-grasp domain-containing protein [Solirubrobacterales bacterium]
MSKILVTAIGSFSADIVLKSLKTQGHYIIGSDIYPKAWIVDAYNVDEFIQMPCAEKKEDYIDYLEKVCIDNKIEFVFPLIDLEVDILSSEKKRFMEKGIVICVSNDESIKLIRNKYNLISFLSEKGFKGMIPTRLIEDNNEFEMPVFIKPVSGRSSQGCRAISNNLEFKCMKSILPGSEYIVQPFIEGNIITVDVVRNPLTNQVVCVCRRELIRNKSGAGLTVEIIENPELESMCAAISEAVGVIGTVNFEFIEGRDGNFYFLEINPRFSGGVEFTHLAGYNVVYNHFCCFINKEIEKRPSVKKAIIVKKYEEYITEYIK